jgi:hypothetical protein
MPRLHENTPFDTDAKAHALVEELEHEALDEDMVALGIENIITVLRSRQEVAVQKVQEERHGRLLDSRRAMLKAKVKGVKPVTPGGSKLQLVDSPVIASRH